MLGQEDEELEFAVGQGDFFSFDVDPVLIDINFQVAAADDFAIGRFLLGLAHEPFIACDVGLDAGYELCRAEGFDDVVVGTEAQAAYLVHVFPLGRYHQNGYFLFLADAAADVKAVGPGQHDVQQDEVEIFLQGRSRPFVPSVSMTLSMALASRKSRSSSAISKLSSMIRIRFIVFLLYPRQGDDDGQAAAGCCFCMNLAVQGRNDLFGNGQAQLLDVRPGGIGPVKTVE